MTYLPLLHLTVWLARVVDKSADVAHAISVDDNAAVQVETVVMTLAGVFFHHPAPELFLTHHLTAVLNDECTYATTNNARK